jgi:hypothetical protein
MCRTGFVFNAMSIIIRSQSLMEIRIWSSTVECHSDCIGREAPMMQASHIVHIAEYFSLGSEDDVVK